MSRRKGEGEKGGRGEDVEWWNRVIGERGGRAERARACKTAAPVRGWVTRAWVLHESCRPPAASRRARGRRDRERCACASPAGHSAEHPAPDAEYEHEHEYEGALACCTSAPSLPCACKTAAPVRGWVTVR